MIHIAVVEDDVKDCAEYAEFIRKYAEETGEKIQVKEFHDGDEIVENYSSDFDIILMDIDMKLMNGMDAAKEIRKVDEKVIIMFMTNMPQYAMEGYKVDALDYVLKPISYFDFSEHLNRAISRMSKRQNTFIKVNVKGGIKKIDISKLELVEVQDHDLIYHTSGDTIITRGTIRDVEQQLSGQGFFRCNKCYLINLAYVDSVKGSDVSVGGQLIQVSRSHRKELLDALNDFMNDVAK